MCNEHAANITLSDLWSWPGAYVSKRDTCKKGLLPKNTGWVRKSVFHARCATVKEWSESVAQLVEHRPFKALVLGSSPSALTISPNY
jgi:hypothetical protein